MAMVEMAIFPYLFSKSQFGTQLVAIYVHYPIYVEITYDSHIYVMPWLVTSVVKNIIIIIQFSKFLQEFSQERNNKKC